MNSRILVLGYFGYFNNQLDGQTIKTRNIYELFKSMSLYDNNICAFDTQDFKYSKLSIFNMFWRILRCNKLVYLPAHNNLKYLFPLIYILCWFKRCEILYFVVGGWLSENLISKKLHVAFLSNIRAILTESNDLRNSLMTQYNFKNVITVPNFRIHSFTPTFNSDKDQFRIVFMARINRMKGLDTVFLLAEYFSTIFLGTRTVIIDFYGPIEKADETYFYEQINKYSFISYRGILQPEDIYKTLNTYDVMAFPTRYFTEGFPGSVLDAYIAGLPVVATHWKHATDFIIQNKTGFIVPFENSQDDFTEAIIKLYKDDDLLLKMKQNAYLQSQKYSAECVWKILIDNNLA